MRYFVYILFIALGGLAFAKEIGLGNFGKMASYYDINIAILDKKVITFTKTNLKPVKIDLEAAQVGVSNDLYFALLTNGELVYWSDENRNYKIITDKIISFSAGETGIFLIKDNNELYYMANVSAKMEKIANNVIFSSIGDGANYYITKNNDLYVKGKAHRGQYGDGKLTETKNFVKTAKDVVEVRGHTGHAVILLKNGDVEATGGNRYGVLSHHGYGDKADKWGTIFKDAKLIASGSSHSLAIKNDDTLWVWGAGFELEPKQIFSDVVAVSAGVDITIFETKNKDIYYMISGKKPVKLKIN